MQIREEAAFTKGRIIVRGSSLPAASQARRLHPLLRVNQWIAHLPEDHPLAQQHRALLSATATINWTVNISVPLQQLHHLYYFVSSCSCRIVFRTSCRAFRAASSIAAISAFARSGS